MRLCGYLLAGQVALLDCVLLDSLSVEQDYLCSAKVDVGWGEVVQARVVAAMVVVVDDAIDVGFEVAGQVVAILCNCAGAGCPSIDPMLKVTPCPRR